MIPTRDSKINVAKLYEKYRGRMAESEEDDDYKLGIICGYNIELGHLIMVIERGEGGWMHSTFSDRIFTKNVLERKFWYVNESDVLMNRRERFSKWIKEWIEHIKKDFK